MKKHAILKFDFNFQGFLNVILFSKKTFILDNSIMNSIMNNNIHDKDPIISVYFYIILFVCLYFYLILYVVFSNLPERHYSNQFIFKTLFTCFIVSRSIKFKHNQTQLICLKCLPTLSYDFLVYITLDDNATALCKASY